MFIKTKVTGETPVVKEIAQDFKVLFNIIFNESFFTGVSLMSSWFTL